VLGCSPPWTDLVHQPGPPVAAALVGGIAGSRLFIGGAPSSCCLSSADMTDPEPDVDDRPVWCIAATVISERPYGPGGVERRRGLKLFSPGAKVHVPDGFHGMGYESVTVVGRVRKSSRYSIVHVRTDHLTNWRVELVYSPTAMIARHRS
jgi:hypothetical protein